MPSNHSSSPAILERPSRWFWVGLGLVVVLVSSYGLLIEGSVLLVAVLAPFTIFVALGGWLAKQLLAYFDVPIRPRPVTVAGALSVFVFLYSLLIEGAVLLGLVACVFVMGAGVAVGIVLALD